MHPGMQPPMLQCLTTMPDERCLGMLFSSLTFLVYIDRFNGSCLLPVLGIVYAGSRAAIDGRVSPKE